MKIKCNYLKTMLKCFIFLISILICFSQCSKISTYSSLDKLSEPEIEQLIGYLSEKRHGKLEKLESHNKIKLNKNLPHFMEVSTEERGTGCEAMNKCSGQGTCKSGTCVCDEGFDYFDCSISTNTSK